MDERPVVYCRGCQTDVVMLPCGSCPWCETRIVHGSHPSRDQVELLHRQRVFRPCPSP